MTKPELDPEKLAYRNFFDELPGYVKNFFDDLPLYISVHDRDLHIIEANRLFKEAFGDPQGRLCYEYLKHRDSKCPQCPVEKAFKEGGCFQHEERLTCQNGREVDVLVQTTPIQKKGGQVIAVMEMATDITPQKKLQKELAESKEVYRILFEEVPCYISIQDQNLRIVEANRRFKEDFGDHKGSYCYEVYKHRNEPCLVCPVANTFADGKIHSSEEVITSLKGERQDVISFAAPIRNSSGEIVHVMEMSTNITQIRQLQSQLTSLGLLVGSISHGVKGLINNLDGGIYIMNSGFAKNDLNRIKEGWNIIQRNIERIRSMMLDVLYYAKERDPDWFEIDATDLSNKVVDLLENKIQKLGVEFIKEIDPKAGKFEVDGKAIQALLVNLLENSIDACRIDIEKSSHQISFSLHREPPWMIFQIKDNGIGMDRETREKVFCLFFSSKGLEGTGLGLFISNKIALKHGGKIEVQSEPNQGTTFTVYLPITKPQENSDEKEKSDK